MFLFLTFMPILMRNKGADICSACSKPTRRVCSMSNCAEMLVLGQSWRVPCSISDWEHPADDGQRDWPLQRIRVHLCTCLLSLLRLQAVSVINIQISLTCHLCVHLGLAVDTLACLVLVCRCGVRQEGSGSAEWLWACWSAHEGGSRYWEDGRVHCQLVPGQRRAWAHRHRSGHHWTPATHGSPCRRYRMCVLCLAV